jgi:hypothetical protein
MEEVLLYLGMSWIRVVLSNECSADSTTSFDEITLRNYDRCGDGKVSSGEQCGKHLPNSVVMILLSNNFC